MAEAAEGAGVQIVTGDTKVVDRGHGDGCYINTAGVGELVRDDITWSASQIQPGDAVITSGHIGDHGMAIMSVREGLKFDATIESDSAPLHWLVEIMLDTGSSIHAMRDPTRGGVASALNELANSSRLGIVVEERRVPINPTTQSACELLGMDPMFVANEGKLLVFVAPDDAQSLLERMRSHPLGRSAAIIGHVTDEHPGIVVARTSIGGTRVIAMQIGQQLPRIC
jgi:hydrogenase expression/formation protein HypE